MIPAGPDRHDNPSGSAGPERGPGSVWVYCLDQDRATTVLPDLCNYCRRLIRAIAENPDPGFRVRVLVSSANAFDLLPAALPRQMDTQAVPGRFARWWRRVLADHVLSAQIPRRTGGISEMMQDTRDGHLLDADNHAGMIQTFRRVAVDLDLCRRFGETGRRHIKVRHRPDTVARQHPKFCRETIAQ